MKRIGTHQLTIRAASIIRLRWQGSCAYFGSLVSERPESGRVIG